MEALLSSLTVNADDLQNHLYLYIVLGVIAIVILSLLLDGVRRFIRGLDTAALGALFLWLGYKTSKILSLDWFSNIMLVVGATLFICGVLIFIIIRVIKSGRKKRALEREQAQQERARREQAAKEQAANAKAAKEQAAKDKAAKDQPAKGQAAEVQPDAGDMEEPKLR